MRKVIVSVVCATITAVCGGALADDWDDEDVNWLEYNDDDGSPDFEELFGAGLDLSSSEEEPGGAYTDGLDDGDCAYIDSTFDRIECWIHMEDEGSVAIGLASYTISGDKAIIMCYDDGSTVTLAGYATLDVAHKLYVHGSDQPDNFFIVREAIYYTAQCDFEDFPNVFDDDYHTYAELQMTGNGGSDVVSGSQWSDYLLIGETVYGKQGNDTIYGESYTTNYLEGNYGDDNITGTYGTDEIYGGNDADTISAGSGDDYVEGGPGNDTMYGQNGDDTLEGEGGNDTIEGGDNSDEIYGDEGDDWLYGYTAANYYDGYIDYLYGNEDEDHLFGITDDYCWGGVDYDVCDCAYESGCND